MWMKFNGRQSIIHLFREHETRPTRIHCNDFIIGAMASRITSLRIVYSTVYSDRSRKTSKLRVTGLCAGYSSGTGEFPAQMASNQENISIWWHHHVTGHNSMVNTNLQTRSDAVVHVPQPTKHPGRIQRNDKNMIAGILPKNHDDVIKWKHFPRYWPFVHSPHKGQWRGALMFCLIRAWINSWVNNCEAGDLRRYLVHCDVIVMGIRRLGNEKTEPTLKFRRPAARLAAYFRVTSVQCVNHTIIRVTLPMK